MLFRVASKVRVTWKKAELQHAGNFLVHHPFPPQAIEFKIQIRGAQPVAQGGSEYKTVNLFKILLSFSTRFYTSFITQICPFYTLGITNLDLLNNFKRLSKGLPHNQGQYVRTFWLICGGRYHENYVWTFFMFVSFRECSCIECVAQDNSSSPSVAQRHQKVGHP